MLSLFQVSSFYRERACPIFNGTLLTCFPGTCDSNRCTIRSNQYKDWQVLFNRNTYTFTSTTITHILVPLTTTYALTSTTYTYPCTTYILTSTTYTFLCITFKSFTCVTWTFSLYHLIISLYHLHIYLYDLLPLTHFLVPFTHLLEPARLENQLCSVPSAFYATQLVNDRIKWVRFFSNIKSFFLVCICMIKSKSHFRSETVKIHFKQEYLKTLDQTKV